MDQSPALSTEQERDIQGIGLAGFRKDHQQLLFVRFNDAASGCRLLASLKDVVASHLEVSSFNRAYSEVRERTGRDDVIEATWVGLMISSKGYTKLDINLATELPSEPAYEAFKAGMAARAPLIGHTRPNDAPSGWIAEFKAETGVDACILIASDDKDDLDAVLVEISDAVSAAGCEVAYQEPSAVLPGPFKGHEHFGFKDGISQPAVAGVDPNPETGEPAAVALGEFVLGYADETGQTAKVGSLWKNGSFVAFERIAQHVAVFRQLAAKAAEGTNPTLNAADLEAKMVGRWPSGAPLEMAPEADPGDGGVTNAFEYKAEPFSDDDGHKTPRFAHVRKANPRDETRPDPEDPVARHRMIRRGVPFGPPLPPGATGDDGQARGLHFFCFVADLARQFEFVQSKWLNDQNFPSGGKPETPNGPYLPPKPGEPADGPDPVVGEHDESASNALHQTSGIHTFVLGPEVVSVTAGEYFFAPSISAIEQLAIGKTASE